ncbi:radical SAM family heme chaperone HemW [Sediminibacterium sp. TEGAF015]|uniref:radical SAM family heme chaperone HemW n=1 Tax=Sediminibacterium sp. TEGAF015 TaxID=575378 RepID=UPI00220984A2|nr:radical SAM family heme chaperone HemW [Sediminibacterium sp. TEGAF015]BDQ13080.1 coproporphyrinogen III oxidase [Sediminibacterium sp. TEGAF015]
MAGIYLHIPFCKKACNYCNFHFSTNQQKMDDLVNALVQEITIQQHYLTDTVETIYFGGGTPSLLKPAHLTLLLETIHQFFTVKADAEITLEANPDDIEPTVLKTWITARINRLSIGIQSFQEADLQWMGRAHNALQAKDCIRMAQEAGITNLSIDLIYGGPTLPHENWEQNLKTAIESGVSHLSCYALTVEPKTALALKINRQELPEIDSLHQSEHFSMLQSITANAGYEQYEISNFALPGKRSKHNSSYWSGAHYLGIGPSAHSFNGFSRQWNISNNSLYIQSILKGAVPFEIEVLTPIQQINEYIMTALRTVEGISAETIDRIAQQPIFTELVKDAQKHIHRGLMECNHHQLLITPAGKFMADGIAADLFRD